MPINADQFKIALENMTRAWAEVPEEHSLLLSLKCSFFDEPEPLCKELIARWHSGKSSHPDKYDLKNEYSNDATGQNRLVNDVMALRTDPCISEADGQLSSAKYKKQEEVIVDVPATSIEVRGMVTPLGERFMQALPCDHRIGQKVVSKANFDGRSGTYVRKGDAGIV
jgi:hypothetical protein